MARFVKAPHRIGDGPDALSLAAMEAGDRRQLRVWLLRPDVQAWWGSAGRAEAEVALALDTPSAICRMIRCEDEAIGYAQAIEAGYLAPDTGATPPGIWECTVFIGSQMHRGRGLGQKALELLVADVFGSTLAIGCSVRVPVRNEAAVRAIEAAGFQWQRVEQDPALGPVWVMQMERPRR